MAVYDQRGDLLDDGRIHVGGVDLFGMGDAQRTEPFPIAWGTIGLTVGATLLASLLATVGPARRAAAIAPPSPSASRTGGREAATAISAGLPSARADPPPRLRRHLGGGDLMRPLRGWARGDIR